MITYYLQYSLVARIHRKEGISKLARYLRDVHQDGIQAERHLKASVINSIILTHLICYQNRHYKTEKLKMIPKCITCTVCTISKHHLFPRIDILETLLWGQRLNWNENVHFISFMFIESDHNCVLACCLWKTGWRKCVGINKEWWEGVRRDAWKVGKTEERSNRLRTQRHLCDLEFDLPTQKQ